MSTLATTTAEIRRQYDEVIAASYDLDPQLVAGRSLSRVLAQLREQSVLAAGLPRLDVLDVGMGTGLFLKQLRDSTSREIRPHGLDISEKMADVAKSRLPDLTAKIDDAANLDRHFDDTSFDLICTHFITGFVPIDILAPKIWEKLKPGGYWSFAGAISGAFPELQRKANNRLLRMMFGRGKQFTADDLLTPVSVDAVVQCFLKHGFEVSADELFKPDVSFRNFDEFMEFGYKGSWFTPFIEELGLQSAGPMLRSLINLVMFPMHDHHCVAIGLAKRPD
jgi:SAM-dependent methyltransferase